MNLPDRASAGVSWVPLLLADRSPNLRRLVLTDLLGRRADDAEVCELKGLSEQDPIVRHLMSLQKPDGSWGTPTGGGETWDGIHPTARALVTLGYLGYGPEHPAVHSAAEFLFARQAEDGSWPLPRSKAEREMREPYTMIPLQTGMPLRALAAAGYASDPRAERAYAWLLAQRLEDGAWASGIKGGKHVFPAGYRRLARSRFGCRTNTTFAVSSLTLHPLHRTSPQAQEGLGHLLAQDTMQAHTLGFEVARIVHGLGRDAGAGGGFFTYFARHDVALLLDLCWRAGASMEDPRVAALVEFVRALQGPYGLWEVPDRPELSRWVSFDLLRSLSRIDAEGDWVPLEPRLPFQPYPKRARRY